MPRHTRTAATLAILAVASLLAPVTRAAAPSMESLAADLYRSLTPDQQKKAALKFDDPARHQELFPGGPRAGIQLRDLTPAQRDQALQLLTAFTSDYGKHKAELIAAQEGKGGLDQYYLAFFGRPGQDKNYAWRIAEHHLTLVDVEVANGHPAEFGPILLGANPPTLFDDEEDALIDLYQTLTPEERAKASRPGKSDSAKPIGNAGVPVRELSDAAQKKVADMMAGRLKFFSPDIQSRIKSLLDQQGGLPPLRIAFWGTADKRCADGGKWDFKLGGPTFLCDYENTRGHIHLSMKGKLVSPNP